MLPFAIYRCLCTQVPIHTENCFSKVDNFKMALFGYTHAFAQTLNDLLLEHPDVALNQLQYGAFREFQSANKSMQLSSLNDLMPLIVGEDQYEIARGEFKSYLKAKNLSTVYEFLYSIATVSCVDPFVRHLIRYGRVCQVK